jgi:MoxR-like ATPase
MKLSLAVEVLWRMAVKEAIASKHEKIEPEHLFEATTRGKDFKENQALEELQKRGVDVEGLAVELAAGPDAIEKSGLSPVKLRRAVRNKLGKGTFEWGSQGEGVVHRSDRTRRAFDDAERIAATYKKSSVTALSLFAALIADDSSPICTVISEAGVDAAKMRALVLQDVEGKLNKHDAKEDSAGDLHTGSMLEKFGRDLTAEAVAGKLPLVIGRRKEILQVIQTLARSTKSNPILVGEPGVGKTAIVEALAQRIVQGKDGPVLKGKRLIELNAGSLVAGTKYRGEFEERMKKLLEEIKATPNLIVFIDEIHTLIGAGDRKGGMDAANLMKPALARGDFKCIGATTIAEYRAYIEKDAALERRFEKIMVPEPSRDEAIQILDGLRERFESHHNVSIGPDAIKAAVDLSIRFDTDHRLPDKAIDLIDRACAQLCVPNLSIRSDSPKNGNERVGVQNIAAVLSEKTGIPADVIGSEYNPAMQRIVDTLNEFLVPEFGDTLELRFTSPVPDDRTETVAGYTVGINKWLSRNEIRAFEGLPPTENGDSFFGTMSDMPIDEVKAQPVKSAKPTSKCSHTSTEKIIDAFMAKKSPARVVKSANDKKAVYLEEWNKAVDKNATLLKKKLIQYFDKQKAEVIKNVNEELKGLEAKEYIYKGVDDMLFDTDSAISTGISLITPFIENFIKESGGSASALVNGTFDSSTSNISKFIADRSKFFAKTINETTKDELFTTIKDGISNGEDLASISERVSEVYVKATDFRTDMIARTEVSASANFGAIEAYTQAGVEKIEWKVVNPEDDDCLMNEGVEVKIGEAFPSGDTYPPIHPNCVCTTIPIFND